jgi:hypothetical protein
MILQEQPMPEKSVRVKVRSPYRVVHEGDPYTEGDTLTVWEATAQQWEQYGWVERAAGK